MKKSRFACLSLLLSSLCFSCGTKNLPEVTAERAGSDSMVLPLYRLTPVFVSDAISSIRVAPSWEWEGKCCFFEKDDSLSKEEFAAAAKAVGAFSDFEENMTVCEGTTLCSYSLKRATNENGVDLRPDSSLAAKQAVYYVGIVEEYFLSLEGRANVPFYVASMVYLDFMPA